MFTNPIKKKKCCLGPMLGSHMRKSKAQEQNERESQFSAQAERWSHLSVPEIPHPCS